MPARIKPIALWSSAGGFVFFLIGCVSIACTSPSNGGPVDSDIDSYVDGDTDMDCAPSDISLISAKTSDVIASVGIVEWSTKVALSSDATIEFGLDTDYGYSAPVNGNEKNYRTLLLGMKPSSTYHFRMVIGDDCRSADYTIETGPLPTGLPNPVVSIPNPDACSDGFIVTSAGMQGDIIYILDKDGDYVWWYFFTEEVDPRSGTGFSRAKMSADGKRMWGGNLNVGGGGGLLFGIGMDGLGTPEVLDIDRHHDFTVLPDESLAYIEYSDNGDRLVERNAEGKTRIVYSLADDFSGAGSDWSHCNAVHYYPSDDTYTLSCLGLNNILKIDRATSSMLWDFEGDSGGDFSGGLWFRQHGHQLEGDGSILVFNNTSGAGGGIEDLGASGGFFEGGSAAVEYTLDMNSGRASPVWRYETGELSTVLGDVQRLPNGNTLVTYSTSGVIHEVTSSMELVRSISSDQFGYADWRPTLYGPPDRY